MDDHSAPEVRSEEVQDIIARMPSAVARVGTILVFLVLGSLVVASWFIKYPDILVAEVLITSEPAPFNLYTRTSGKLVLLKSDSSFCRRGEIIGYIQTSASVGEVLELERQLTEGLQVEDVTHVGDLQTWLSSYSRAQMTFSTFQETRPFDAKVRQLKRQLLTYGRLANSLHNQRSLAKQELSFAREKFKADSILKQQNVLATLDFNQSKIQWVQQQRSLEMIEVSFLNNELQKLTIQKEIADLILQRDEQNNLLAMASINAKEELINAIAKWKEINLFIAPTEGRVAHIGFLENEIFLDNGTHAFSILPSEGKIVARVELPLRGSGKVRSGQAVNIQLDNYPYEQFGVIRGTIRSISEIPNDGKYYVFLELPEKLITTHKRIITFRHQLHGKTEIITEDLRLIERVSSTFKRLLNRT